jgi:uncharacterized protein
LLLHISTLCLSSIVQIAIHGSGRRNLIALEPRLRDVWPGATKFERWFDELLRAAYVKVRYARHDRVTAEEPNWVGSRVVLRGLIEDLCLKRIEALKAAA